ncbi:MAG TPA: hypothetical protein VGD81_18475, partial [Opitutaceae bacterium]
MAARLVYLVQLFGWIAAVLLLAVALIDTSWSRAAQAGICCALSISGRAWLRHTKQLKPCSESFDTLFCGPDLGGGPAAAGPEAEQL